MKPQAQTRNYIMEQLWHQSRDQFGIKFKCTLEHRLRNQFSFQLNNQLAVQLWDQLSNYIDDQSYLIFYDWLK